MKNILTSITVLTLALLSSAAFAKICSTSDYSNDKDPYSAIYSIEVAKDLSSLKLSYRIGITQFTIDETFPVTHRENGNKNLTAVKGNKALSLALSGNQATFFMAVRGAEKGISGPMICK